ncbi:MAG: hypothetical protein ACREOF_09510 [Gemmatimonadales bacterium]
MSFRSIYAGLAALAIVAACGERVPPTAVDEPGPSFAHGAAPAADQRRHERLARRVARALRDPEFRSRVKAELDRSPFVEGKVHFQRLLTGGPEPALADLSRLNAETDEAVGADALGAVALELYLPVPEHRARWNGGADVLVATAIHDRDVPVAYDLRGRRIALSPDTPPSTPVLALVPAETRFDESSRDRVSGAAVVCPFGVGRIGSRCGSGGGGTGTTPGLWMTYSSFTQTFEGWLKGSPEFEIHILGQAGASDSLTSYQCAGEHAGGPYAFDQNSLTWTGNVLLFSQAQIDGYKQQHPGQSVRVFALEDDDTACQIKLDTDRVSNLFRTLDSRYHQLTGGRDTTAATTLGRYWNRAAAFQKLFKAVWSVLVTKDEMIGNAVQDAVAGEFRPGANWIVKGENMITYGALKLVMR